MIDVRRVTPTSRWTAAWAHTRRPQQPDLLYAEFPRRAVAFLIDLALATAAVVILAQVAASFSRHSVWWETNAFALIALFLVALGCVLPTTWIAYLWHRGRSTPGHRLVGLSVLHRTTGERLSAMAAFSRWVLLYAPVALWAYPVVVSTAYDPSPFLILIELPRAPFVGMVLPLAWYVVLAVSTLRDRRRGRGLHDRICGSIVVRRSALPSRLYSRAK